VIIQSSVINARLQERSQQLEPDLDEYSASYFDDYDGEDDSSDMGTESDDDFDETTLWEIASLLKTSDVPSTNSLLPLARALDWSDDVADQYNQNSDFDGSYLEENGEVAKGPTMQLPIQPLTTTKPCSLLWTKGGALKLKTAEYGLPQPAKATWTLLISMGNAARSKAHYFESLPSVQSSRLWESEPAHSQNSTASLMWTGQSVYQTAVTTLFKNQLWEKLPSDESFQESGLFMARESMKVIHTTTQLPAALPAVYKSRTNPSPLAKLTSNKLWDGCKFSESERDWISESSIRPESPFIASVTSSGQSSPISDSSSIKSTSTKASSIWGSFTSSMPWSLKAVKKSTPRSPVAAPETSPKFPAQQVTKRSASPVAEPTRNTKIPAPVNKLASVRESRVLSSHDLVEERKPTLYTKLVNKSQKGTKLAAPLAKSPSRRHEAVESWEDALSEAISAGKLKMTRPHQAATSADWQAALNVAISASKARLNRSYATPEMWKTALDEAVTAGTVGSKLYDSSVRHPVFFSKNMTSTSTDIHPAAIGHCTIIEKQVNTSTIAEATLSFDSSVCHPVLFAKNMTSTSTDIHLAAIGHCTIIDKAVLWMPTIATKDSTSDKLWSTAKVTKKVKPAMFAAVKNESVRVARVLESIHVARLNSSSCWKAPDTCPPKRNWLIESSKLASKILTWMPDVAPVLAENQNNLLWSKSTSMIISAEAFVDETSSPVRKLASPLSSGLSVLASSSLWQCSLAPTSEKNWLLTSPRTKNVLWTSSESLSYEDGSLMWSTKRVFDRNTPMELNSRDQEGYNVPRAIAGSLLLLESSTLWQPRQATTSRPNWLTVNHKFEPVKSLTWTPSLQSSSPNYTAMWSMTKSAQSAQEEDIFGHVVCDRIRKASALPSTKLPSLQSTHLFERRQTTTQGKNWLLSACRSKVVTSSSANSIFLGTWIPTAAVVFSGQESLMWEKSAPAVFSSPTIFANPHTDLWIRAKRALEPVKTIDSFEMWRRSTKIPTSPRNWLVNKAINKVEFRY
jgi:hypothetical protein